MSRTVLFDLDGTLIDSAGDICAAFEHAAGELGGAAIGHERIVPLIGRPLAFMARELGLSLEPEQERLFEDVYRARFDALDCAHARVFGGMRELLESLGPERTGIVTGKIQYQAEHVARRMDLASLVRHVQGWRAGLHAKPAPDLLAEALRAMGVRAPDAVYVGDAPTDVIAAHAAGLRAIAVSWGFGDPAALRDARPDAIVGDADELRRAIAG